MFLQEMRGGKPAGKWIWRCHIDLTDAQVQVWDMLRPYVALYDAAIFTADALDAQRLLDELAFFAPDLRCVLFPDWETLPYDTFSPHQDLISERLATLWRLMRKDLNVILVPASTAATRICPPSFLAATTFHFKQKTRLDESALKSQLTLAGYNHVSQVVAPGEYAVRGGILDLFPAGLEQPVRFDFFGDTLESILADVQARPLERRRADAAFAALLKDRTLASGEQINVVVQPLPDPANGSRLLSLSVGATKAQFDATIGIHPTAAEEFVTMREKWTG